MKRFGRGTPAFGLCLGAALAGAGALVMIIGFWKTLILSLLFVLGYFLGAVGDKEKFLKDTVNRVIPEKKEENINFREELTREQESLYRDLVSGKNGEKEADKEEDGE